MDAENFNGSAPKKRVIGRPFVKGQRANPAGRPKQMPDMRAMFRQHTPEALTALLTALKQPRYRVAAAATILAYGWGRPMTTADVVQAGAGMMRRHSF